MARSCNQRANLLRCFTVVSIDEELGKEQHPVEHAERMDPRLSLIALYPGGTRRNEQRQGETAISTHPPSVTPCEIRCRAARHASAKRDEGDERLEGSEAVKQYNRGRGW